MNNKITINDLKYDELRIILKTLSVRQLFSCLTVCKKFESIIREILESQEVLTLLYNDVNLYTKEELELMCSKSSHIAINSSIGRIVGTQAMISPFIRLDFSRIRDKLLNLIQFCPNVQSLNLDQFSVKNSDIQLILSHCPRLQCLSITSDDKFWANILLNSITGLKHLSLSLTSKRCDSVFGSDTNVRSGESPQIEELVIDGPVTDSFSADILCSLLKTISSKIIKFHFRPSNPMSNERVIDIIQALSGDEPNRSFIKNLNINVLVFNEMIEAINSQLLSLEILYLHFNSQSNESVSLKKLKNLKQIHLNFNTTNHDFELRANSENENSVQLFTLLFNFPLTVKKLTLSNAFISLSVFKEIINYLPVLQELELNYVCIEMDSQHNFWQVIASFKNLHSLTLNLTDISDHDCEHIAESPSLNTLELVKYNGPKAGETLISSNKIIKSFADLANLNPDKWFNLRLDIDVFEVNDEIKREIPRNMRLLNVGFKK